MRGETLGGAGVDVAAQTQLERNPLVEDVLREVAHLHDRRRILHVHGDVVDEPRRVADTVRAAPLDRLPDAFLAERLARVNRDVEVRALNVVERVDMFLRRETAFFAGEIESDHAAVAKVDGELRHLL